MRQLSFLFVGFIFSFGTNLNAQTQFDVAHLAAFENYLKTEIDSAQIAGAEVLIYHNQKKVWHKALGEKGLLSLDDLAQDFVPELGELRVIEDMATGINGPTIPVEQPITIQHLLTHTSGLSHGLENHLFDQTVVL